MKREILFRGKRIDTGEWVEGSLCVDQNKAYIITDLDFGGRPLDLESEENWFACLPYEVHPATICQYTGLKDRNGNKIFEGDIVYRVIRAGIEEYEDVLTDIRRLPCIDMEHIESVEIIGNIHDEVKDA